MPTTDSQANSPVMEFARTITHWCDAKLGFREWIASQGAEQCRYVASRHKSEKKADDEGKSDQCVRYEYPHPPFEGVKLSLGEIAIFAVDRFNRLNPKNKIAPKGLSGSAKNVWHLSQIHESDLPTFGHNLSDSADEISESKIQGFLKTLEEQFTREALPDVFAAPRSKVEEVCVLASGMRRQASGKLAGVVAGALSELRNWFFEAGGNAVLPNVPDSTAVFQDGVVDWLSCMIAACEPHAPLVKPGYAELTRQQRMIMNKLEDNSGPANQPELDAPTKAKRSTERGEGRAKLVAALTKHHKYADGDDLNLERIGNNALAELAHVAKGTASAFFRKEFKGHAKYRGLCTKENRHWLIAAIKALNGEFQPHEFYVARTPDEAKREREEYDE